MSYSDHNNARRVKGLRGTTRAVFLELAHRTSHDDDLHECSVKVATLAKAVGKADQAIRLAIKELRGVNLIQTTRRLRKNGTRSCFKFKLVMPFPDLVTVPNRAPRKTQLAVKSIHQPAVNSIEQPAVICTALLSEPSLLSGYSLDQGFIKKIEAAAEPSSSLLINKDSEAEKTVEKIQTGIEPPYSAYPPIDEIVNRYRKTPTATAFLACMHNLRAHLGLKALKAFPKKDYMHPDGLFDIVGSPSRAFDFLADFARTWAITKGKRPHFSPRQVYFHFSATIGAQHMALNNELEPNSCDALKCYQPGDE